MVRLASYPRALGVAAAVALVATVLPGAPATGQVPGLVIDPPNPGPGQPFTVSGTCLHETEAGDLVPALARVGIAVIEPDEWFDLLVGEDGVEPEVASDGSWTAEFVVPEDLMPGDDLFIGSHCTGGSFFTNSGSLGVGELVTPTTTTTTTTTPPETTTTTSTTMPDPPDPDPAPPAPAVNGAPGFTG